MSKTVKILSKEGKEVEINEEAAKTSKYLQTVLKEDPECGSINTSIPYASLLLAKDFCKSAWCFVTPSGVPCGQTDGRHSQATH